MEPVRYVKSNHLRLVTEIFLVLGGICIFAWFVHREGVLFLIAVAGLIFASVILSRAVFISPSPAGLLGLDIYDFKVLIFSFAGLAAGLAAALGYHSFYGIQNLPGALTIIALVSPLIGITEEIIFRGYLQGRAQQFGPAVAVAGAAAGHTLYKYLVLKSLTVPVVIDFPRLVLFTFLFGLAVGIFRQISRSVIPALAAHALFDILVYGDFSAMPVWVWG